MRFGHRAARTAHQVSWTSLVQLCNLDSDIQRFIPTVLGTLNEPRSSPSNQESV